MSNGSGAPKMEVLRGPQLAERLWDLSHKPSAFHPYLRPLSFSSNDRGQIGQASRSIIFTTKCPQSAKEIFDCVRWDSRADHVQTCAMTPSADIRANVAESGSTQINNVNLTTSMFDPVHDNCERNEAHGCTQRTLSMT